MDYKDALLWCEQFEENILLVAPERDKMVLSLQAMKKCREALEKQIKAEKPFLQITVDTELTAEMKETLKSQQCVIITDTLEKTFVEGCKDLRKKGEGSDEILNWYRNLYYKEDVNTERRIVAEALNDILPELVKLRGFPCGKAARNKIRKTIIALLKYEIVNTPSEFKGVKATPDFLNGVAHRQHEILDILKVMAGETNA